VRNSVYHELQRTLSGKAAELLAASQLAWTAYVEQEEKSMVCIDRSMVLESGCVEGDHSVNPYRAILARLQKWRDEELTRFHKKMIFSGKVEERATIREEKLALVELHGDVIYYLPESYRKYAYLSQKSWNVFFDSNSAFLEQFYSDEKAVESERRRMLHERRSVLSCQLQASRILHTEYEE
jgi:hypothetical protein